jgi:hypothetical protein
MLSSGVDLWSILAWTAVSLDVAMPLLIEAFWSLFFPLACHYERGQPDKTAPGACAKPHPKLLDIF